MSVLLDADFCKCCKAGDDDGGRRIESGIADSFDIELDYFVTLSNDITLCDKRGEMFSLQLYRVNADMNQCLHAFRRYESDGVLGFEQRLYSSREWSMDYANSR